MSNFASLRPPTSSDAGLYSPTEVSSPDIPGLEESFTIYLGQYVQPDHKSLAEVYFKRWYVYLYNFAY